MYFPVIRNNRNNWLDTAFNDLFDMDWTPRHVTTAPAVNVKENDKAFTMEVAAPGLKKEFCKVNINNEGNLVVKIENKTEHEDKQHISAKVEDGILSIELPKLAPEPEKKMDRVIDIA